MPSRPAPTLGAFSASPFPAPRGSPGPVGESRERGQSSPAPRRAGATLRAQSSSWADGLVAFARVLARAWRSRGKRLPRRLRPSPRASERPSAPAPAGPRGGTRSPRGAATAAPRPPWQPPASQRAACLGAGAPIGSGSRPSSSCVQSDPRADRAPRGCGGAASAPPRGRPPLPAFVLQRVVRSSGPATAGEQALRVLP